MPKYYCDYCDVFLTHDSSSVRKAHNAGRNHLVNVKDYYAALSHNKAQNIIDEIVRVYMRGGPPGPVGSMFPGVLAQGGPAASTGFGAPRPSVPPPSSSMPSGPPPQSRFPQAGRPSFQPPMGMPTPPPGMPMMSSGGGGRGGPPPAMPPPGQSLGLPPIDSPANRSGPPTEGPKINPQRAAALGLR